MLRQDVQMDVTELEKRMRPGALSVEGFLGPSESLAGILARDRVTMQELNLTHEELASNLEALIRAAEQSRTRSAHIGHFEVTVTIFTGFQICPWSPDPDQGQCCAGGSIQYGHRDWTITNLKSQMKMAGSGLLVHLIRDHHFFEGLDSPYRISPAKLAQFLELATKQ
jgi:hypothetical protein